MTTEDLERLKELEEMLDLEEELDEEERDELRNLRQYRSAERARERMLKRWKAAKSVWRCPSSELDCVVDSKEKGFTYAFKKDDFFSEFEKRPNSPYYEHDMRVRAGIEKKIEYVDRPQSMDGLIFGTNLVWDEETES